MINLFIVLTTYKMENGNNINYPNIALAELRLVGDHCELIKYQSSA